MQKMNKYIEKYRLNEYEKIVYSYLKNPNTILLFFFFKRQSRCASASGGGAEGERERLSSRLHARCRGHGARLPAGSQDQEIMT